jgi:hypothetical protein
VLPAIILGVGQSVPTLEIVERGFLPLCSRARSESVRATLKEGFMAQKVLLGLLSLCMAMTVVGCDESDVATGVIAGAVVGGTIVAVASDNYDYDDYYYDRYDSYYYDRSIHYGTSYGPTYYGNRYGSYNDGRHRNSWNNDRRGRGHVNHHRGNRGGNGRGHRRPYSGGIQDIAAMKPAISKVEKFADFYQMPMDSAKIILAAQQQAIKGDISGLVKMGVFADDIKRLANMQPATKEAVYRISLRTGLSEAHASDVLVDFQQELSAAKKAGRVAL